MNKAWSIIKGVFWSAIIVAAMFIIFSSLNLFGYQMYVVKSGSMEPKIHTGSVVIDRKSNDYKLDNVITFKLKDSKDTVTHRVVAVKTDEGVTAYTTKGDANRTADPDPVLKSNIVGRVLFSIPYIGYLIAFMRTLPGLLIFIIVPAVIIVSDEIANIKTEASKIKTKRKETKKTRVETKEAEDLDIPPDLVEVEVPKKKPIPKRGLIQ